MPKAAADDRRLARVAKICLALPETSRLPFGTHARFLVGKKTFAYFMDDHHGDGIVGIWCKFEPGGNAALVASDPERFYIPPYVGTKGWIGIRLNRATVDWDEVESLLRTSFRLVAPKRLAHLG